MIEITEQKNDFAKIFISCFTPFALAFILTCLYRTMNAVLLPSLTESISLTPSDVGFLTSVFFLAYGIFQFPIGPLLDKYGPRKVKTALLFVAALGLLFSAMSHNLTELSLSHFLIGVGASGGLIAGFKMIVQWFPQNRIAMLNAFMMMSGGAGILLGTTPTDVLSQAVGWRELYIIYSIVTIIVAAIIFFIVPESDVALEKSSFRQQFSGIVSIYRNPLFWRLAPFFASILGTFMAFQGLWVENWLLNVDHYAQSNADNYLLLIGVGMTLSVLSTGYVAKYSRKYNIKMSRILMIFTLLYLVVQIAIYARFKFATWLIWFSFGFLSQLFNLCFAIYANHFPKEFSGRVNSAQNILTYVVVFASQYLMGIIIGLWQKTNGSYPVVAYKYAFFIIILLQLITIFWFLLFEKITKIKSAKITV